MVIESREQGYDWEATERPEPNLIELAHSLMKHGLRVIQTADGMAVINPITRKRETEYRMAH